MSPVRFYSQCESMERYRGLRLVVRSFAITFVAALVLFALLH